MSNDPRYHSTRWSRLRAWVLRREPLCRYCAERGVATVATTVDHIKPIARGGDFWSPANLAPACAACNYSKADTPLDEWMQGGCGADGYGSFWDERASASPLTAGSVEKNQSVRNLTDRCRIALHTKRVSEGG